MRGKSKLVSENLNDLEMQTTLEKDKGLRIGSTHGDETSEHDRAGYARDIGQSEAGKVSSREARTEGAGLTAYARKHPSRDLNARRKGFGIGGGYERAYRREKQSPGDSEKGLYGPLPHSGYYGTGMGERPFKKGQASFNEELSWYRSQYGERATDYKGEK
jgi:hypothetical protein